MSARKRVLGMSLCTLVMGLSLSRPAAAQVDMADAADGYTVIEVPSDGIERYMPIGTAADHLPPAIQGIWWMDGNPSGDILVSLAGSDWDPVTRTATLKVWGPGNYTFYPSDSVKNSYQDLVRTHARFLVQFNEDYTFATLTPAADPGGDFANPKDVVFTMYLEGDGHWVRESWYFGIKVLDYQLRRVVRADGKRDPAYANYLMVAKPTSMIGYKYK